MVISRALTFALVLSLALLRMAMADTGHAAVSCQIDSLPKTVTDAWAALQRRPDELPRQLAVADALIDQGCYKEAVPVLEGGLAQRPGSSELESRLRAARSMLNEEHFFEGLGSAQEAARLQHSVMRCTKLFDLSACDDALHVKPDDPQLVIAKGDALAHSGRPADAILVYLRAASLLPGDDGAKSKLAAAESQREALVSQCEGDADAAAADACQAALLHGSQDEFTLLKRRGILLQSLDKPEQALDAFIAANVLKQNDKSVALAIVALTDSTGRRDAMALAARGSSLLTLGRAPEALQALREAEALAPALPKIKTQLAQAAQAVREDAKRQRRTASAKAAGSNATGGAGGAFDGTDTARSTTAAGSIEGARGSGAEGKSAAGGRSPPGARVAASGAVTYSNDADAAHSN
jgi:tetratricopeptide (TPR) repeat protein